MSRTFVSAALLILLSTPAMAQMRGGEGIFERADADNDGSVTREEFSAARTGQFAKLDRNSDGYIDSNDVPKRLAARRQQKGGGDFMVGQFDADGDGKVSKEEFVNGPTLAFDRADTNKDNVLDAKELVAAKEAVKEKGEEWRSRKRQ
jgi:Ca2+-binding EF-hand superfamily protein